MNASMFLRSASMQGDMLPLMSTTNTMSATPLVLARACGAGAAAAGAAMPGQTWSMVAACTGASASVTPGAGSAEGVGCAEGVASVLRGEGGSRGSVSVMLQL